MPSMPYMASVLAAKTDTIDHVVSIPKSVITRTQRTLCLWDIRGKFISASDVQPSMVHERYDAVSFP
ncbi:MAG: hypothetical protein MKZ98_13755, partial [Pseudomonadales bacterium]|nr:hypothetical protein [Pseudomonadales bacterium]